MSLFIKDLGYIQGKSQRYRMKTLECPKCKEHFDTYYGNYPKTCKKCINVSHSYCLDSKRLYDCWHSIKRRCYNKTSKSYKNYGNRGIILSEEWKEFKNFREWALANGYKENLSIDRINNDGNYEPNNCRWTDDFIQNRNTRRLRQNNTSGYRGVSFCKQTNRWSSSITINGKNVHLGRHDTAEVAAITRDLYVISNNLEHTTNFERIKLC